MCCNEVLYLLFHWCHVEGWLGLFKVKLFPLFAWASPHLFDVNKETWTWTSLLLTCTSVHTGSDWQHLPCLLNIPGTKSTTPLDLTTFPSLWLTSCTHAVTTALHSSARTSLHPPAFSCSSPRNVLLGLHGQKSQSTTKAWASKLPRTWWWRGPISLFWDVALTTLHMISF